MPKKYPYHFTTADLRQGCKRCIENVKALLDSASILLENRGTEQYALGIYMYAVEEYGKAILLKKHILGKKRKYLIDGWILGYHIPRVAKNGKTFNAHDEKIKIGFDNLPLDCRLIVRGIATREPFDSARIVTVKENEFGQAIKVLIPASITGKFINTTDSLIFDYNSDLKTACFYIDWELANKTWTYSIATDPKQLKKNIKCFENMLVNFSCMD